MTDDTGTTGRLDKVLTFDRHDFQVARLALVLSALAVGLLTVVRPLWHWVAGDALQGTVTTDADLPTPPYETREGATLAWTGDLVVTLDSPGAADRLSALAPGVVLTLAAVAVAWLLLRLLTAIQSGHPFTRRTVWTLRGVAATLLGVMLLLPMAHSVREARFATVALAETSDLVLTLDPMPTLLLATIALVVASLGEAFARGTRLADDVEGLV